MELIVYNTPNESMKLEQAKIVPGLESITWIERYDDMSEFSVESRFPADIRLMLPIGSFVSHTKTAELMMVTSHTIVHDESGVLIRVEGKSFLHVFEQRIVGSNRSWPFEDLKQPFRIDTEVTSAMAARLLIILHVYPEYMNDPRGADAGLEYLRAQLLIEREGILELNTYEYSPGTLYEKVRETLKSDDLGVRVLRPSDLSLDSENTVVYIHDGVDRSAGVFFHDVKNNFGSSEYFWSQDGYFNSVYATSTWLQRVVSGGDGKNRRMAHLDLSWIDEQWSEEPTEAEKWWIFTRMDSEVVRFLRGASKPTKYAQFSVNESNPGLVFRRDYNVGDIVSALGAYDDSASKRRIVEYAEFRDANGYRGYPTLKELF